MLQKGARANALVAYTNGYVLGQNDEPPFAYVVLTGDITFGGFSSWYKDGTEGVLVFVQDATGGRTVDWNNKLTWTGSSSLTLAANAISVFDVIKTPVGWVGSKRA